MIRGKDYLNIKMIVKFSYIIKNKRNKELKENENSFSMEYAFPRCEWKRLINVDSNKVNIDENEILYYFYKNKIWKDDSPEDMNHIITNFITKFGDDDIKYVLDVLCDKKYIYRDDNKYGILKSDYRKIEKLVISQRFKYWLGDKSEKFVGYIKEHPTAILLIIILVLQVIAYYSENKTLERMLFNFTDRFMKP